MNGLAGSRAARLFPGLRPGTLIFPAALIAMIAIGVLINENFRTADNFRNIMAFASIGFIVALGETFVVIARAIDLSVGSMVALSGAIFAKLYVDGVPLWACIAATVGIGAALGVVAHGIVITKIKVSFLIVTLGTFAIFRSQSDVLLGGQSIFVDNSTLDWLANGRVGEFPVIVLQAFALYLVMLFLQRATTYGRYVYAVGANPGAARVAGIPVDAVLIVTFGLCSALAAWAGIMTTAQLGSAQPTAGIGLELVAIGAVLVGGTSFAGGQGGVTGTLVGALFLAILANLLLLEGVNSFWQGTAAGLVLICAVALDRSRRGG
jgi:ribose transport system permease protein